jgi:hypothetical protein
MIYQHKSPCLAPALAILPATGAVTATIIPAAVVSIAPARLPGRQGEYLPLPAAAVPLAGPGTTATEVAPPPLLVAAAISMRAAKIVARMDGAPAPALAPARPRPPRPSSLPRARPRPLAPVPAPPFRSSSRSQPCSRGRRADDGPELQRVGNIRTQSLGRII